MNDEVKDVFKLEPSLLDCVDVSGITQDVLDGTHCGDFSGVLGMAAKGAETAGQVDEASVLRVLGSLMSFQSNFEDKGKPFRPFMISREGRSFLPNDLSARDLGIVRRLVEMVSEPLLRARLCDVLWVVEHDHSMLGLGADAYLDAAVKLDSDDDWIHAMPCFHRALEFAIRLGRKKERFGRVEEAVVSWILRESAREEGFPTCRMMELAIRFGVGDPASLAAIAHDIGQRLAESGEHRSCREYWELEAKFHWGAKDEKARDKARLRAAGTFIREAESRLNSKTGGAMAAASLLRDGVEALRLAGGAKKEIERLRVRLCELQADSRSEMQTYEYELDLSEGAKWAESVVSHEEPAEALERFAFAHPLADLDEMKQKVIQLAKENPLSFLLGTEIVDEKGRAQGFMKGGTDFEGDEEALGAQLFAYAARFFWSIRASAFIEPARVKIYNDHHIVLGDLIPLVSGNPFVPPGHEEIYARGLDAGFAGDFLVASHLLVPQIENSVRYVLESEGVDVSNLESDGMQPLKLWGGLIAMPETTEVFGEELVFEFRGLLLEKAGYGLRNSIAHGFVSDAEARSDAAVNVWWLVLRILLTPFVRCLQGRDDEC